MFGYHQIFYRSFRGEIQYVLLSCSSCLDAGRLMGDPYYAIDFDSLWVCMRSLGEIKRGPRYIFSFNASHFSVAIFEILLLTLTGHLLCLSNLLRRHHFFSNVSVFRRIRIALHSTKT